MNDEVKALEKIAKNSLYAEGVCQITTIKYSFQVFEKYLCGASILEMGPAEGVMTELLYNKDYSLSVIEGSRIFSEGISSRFPGVTVYNSLFEEFKTDKKFDNIILGHVLEYVDDPVAILKHIKTFLSPNGVILAAVPNARSLHRQASVIMGLLSEETELNELDKHHGHRRVFTPETFRNIFYQSGLKVDFFGGYWLKPISNAQIEKSWTQEMLDAFMMLGERYPDIAGEIYVVASNR